MSETLADLATRVLHTAERAFVADALELAARVLALQQQLAQIQRYLLRLERNSKGQDFQPRLIPIDDVKLRRDDEIAWMKAADVIACVGSPKGVE